MASAANNLSGTTVSKIFYLLLVDQLYANEVNFCSSVRKSNQACIKYSPTQMYLTFSIRLPHIDSPTELFIKKFFFRWSTHFSASQRKSPKAKEVHVISTAHHPPRIPWNNSKKHINPVVNNSSVATVFKITISKIYWSPQVRFLTVCFAPTSNDKVINFSPLVSLNVSRTIISIVGFRTPRLTLIY